MGKVYLVGAGPGDAGLITQKGLEKLRQCDALVYDRLAAEELLDEAPEQCERIYVGKQPGRHSRRQEEINTILLECAEKYPIVVRLKGGDPFVFGRGGEEIEMLAAHGIPYEVIPGVTSAVAVPECAGIPVTHRGVSREFHVITGHTMEKSLTCNYERLAGMEGTLLFLMGMAHLPEIAEKLVGAGKPGDTPAAVISEGTTAAQRVVRATLETIVERVKEQQIKNPAVIVIGETAAYDFFYHSEQVKRVGVTATELLWKKMETGFEGLGMQPVRLCDMQVVTTEQMRELEQALYHLETIQWILFTSQNAVVLFFSAMRRKHIDGRQLGTVKFAVLGSGTQKKLAEYGIYADFIPSRYTVETLAEELCKRLGAEEQVLIPRAKQGSRQLNAILDRYGITYQDIPIYDVRGHMTEQVNCLEKMDYLVFVSASGVSAFFQELRACGKTVPEHARMVCIGEMTKKRLEQEYGAADIVAAVNDVDGLLQAVKISKVF